MSLVVDASVAVKWVVLEESRADALRRTAGVDLVPHKAKQREVRAVLNNSFGFGGTNASLVMKSVD